MGSWSLRTHKRQEQPSDVASNAGRRGRQTSFAQPLSERCHRPARGPTPYARQNSKARLQSTKDRRPKIRGESAAINLGSCPFAERHDFVCAETRAGSQCHRSGEIIKNTAISTDYSRETAIWRPMTSLAARSSLREHTGLICDGDT